MAFNETGADSHSVLQHLPARTLQLFNVLFIIRVTVLM